MATETRLQRIDNHREVKAPENPSQTWSRPSRPRISEGSHSEAADLERGKKRACSRSVHNLLEDDWRKMGQAEIQEDPEASMDTNRIRNRPANSGNKPAHRNISPLAERDWHASRRSVETKMDRP